MMIRHLRTFMQLCGGFASLAIVSVCHADFAIESPARSVPLIELFTSEGCSSCPPAEAWLSDLRASDGLWSRFVPIAFHVTYWDSLGWRDRFAQSAFDSLQTAVARRAGTSVYTPGVFVAGREWRSWRRDRNAFEQLPSAIVGPLKAKVRDTSVDVAFVSSVRIEAPTINLALLTSDQSTEVLHGENAGKTLHHDFVVRALKVTRLQGVNATWQTTITLPAADLASSRAVALWVADADGLPVQAAGGWLPNAVSKISKSD